MRNPWGQTKGAISHGHLAKRHYRKAALYFSCARGDLGNVGNGHGVPQSLHSPGSDETDVSTGKAFPCLHGYVQTAQSMTADGPEGSCPRKRKKHIGNASKQKLQRPSADTN